jgi:hypothetical protein
VLNLHLRQAECALSDGRLDEALQLANDPKVRRHRQGQALVGRLTAALADRSRQHLDAGRLQEALSDCEKAVTLGGIQETTTELRRRIAEALLDQQKSQQHRQGALAVAREHLAHDRLTLGERALDHADAGAEGQTDRLHLDNRRAGEQADADAIRAALDRGDWAGAIDRLLAIDNRRRQRTALAELQREAETIVTQRVRQALNDGRLDRAELLARRLTALAPDTPDTQEWTRILAQLGRARSAVEAGRCRQGAQVLRRLAVALPDADWLIPSAEQCESAAASLDALASGPLGLAGDIEDFPDANASDRPPVAAPKAPAPAAPAAPPAPRLRVQIDGVGGFLLVRKNRVTVGPISSDQRPDVGLLADPSHPVAVIERSEGDYFLHGPEGVTVNGRDGGPHMLADGDRVAVGTRCRLRFRRPNPASSTALLDLSGGKLPQGDIRRVILMDREVLIGPGAAHLRADQLSRPIALVMRSGRLHLQSDPPARAGDAELSADDPLPLDTPVRVGPVSMVISECA